MQRLDDAKRQAIIDAAAQLFAQRSFHEVKLDEVAAAAHIGKGTVYLYFQSKEDLHASVAKDGFAQLVNSVRAHIDEAAHPDAWEALDAIVHAIVRFAKARANFFQLMRTANRHSDDGQLRQMRRELGNLIESVLKRGVRAGIIDDPHPQLTAQFIPAFIRAAFVHGPQEVSEEALATHILRVLGKGIRSNKS